MKRMKEIVAHNIVIKVFALILAFFVWRAVGEVSDPVVTVTYRDVAVTMLNEELVTDAGKVYQVSDNTLMVVVQVTAKTSIQERISKEDIIATADFEDILLTELVPVNVTISGYEFSSLVSVVVSPSNIVVSIEDSTSKIFPIVPSASGELDTIYALGEMDANPETVTINGPESLVNSIVRVEGKVNITGITEDSVLEGELILYDEDNSVIDQTLLTIQLSCDLEISVEVLDTKSVGLELSTSGEPKSGYEVASITAEPTEIIVAGKKEDLELIDNIIIPGEAIDVTGKSGKLEMAIDITDYIPENISMYDENSSTIAVTVQIDELGTKSLDIPVQSIVVNNNPSDLTLSYDNVTTVMVTFSGLDYYLDSLTSSDVQLSIDLKDYDQAGTYSVPVTISTTAGVELQEEIEVPIVLTEVGATND